MYYDISYDNIAIVMGLLILIVKRDFFKSKDMLEKKYIWLVSFAVISNGVELVTALAYSNYIALGDQMLLTFETVYLLFAICCCYLMLRVICIAAEYNSENFRAGNFVAVGVMTVALLINIGGKFIFEYKNHVFVGYNLFILVYLVNSVFFFEIAYIIFKFRSRLRRKIVIVSSLMFILPIIAIIIQYFDDRLLLSGLGVTLALLMFGFTLGEKDYFELEKMRTELEQEKELEQKRRNEIENLYCVKSKFIENIRKKLREPVEEVKKVNKAIKEDSNDQNVEKYVKHIDKASDELLAFVNEMIEEEMA